MKASGALDRGGPIIAGRLSYEPFGDHALLEASQQLFGAYAVPIFDLTGADLVVDFGSDFLDTGRSPVEHSRQLSEGRDVALQADGGARVIAIGARMNLTASNADIWVPAKPGSEGALALALAQAVANAKGDAVVAAATGSANKSAAIAAAGIDAALFDKLVAKLAGAKRAVALPPGVASSSTAGRSDAAAVLLLNAAVGAIGTSVQYPAVDAKRTASLADVKALIEKMNAGQVECLLIHDLNPVYSLPAALGFRDALAKVELVVAFAPLVGRDDGAREPAAARPHADGELGRCEPAARRPLAGPADGPAALRYPGPGRHAALGGARDRRRRRRDAARRQLEERARVQLGGDELAPCPRARRRVRRDADPLGRDLARALAGIRVRTPELAGSGDFTLIAFPHSFWGDGRGAALPWNQEMPDPVTKLSWNSWVELSHNKAAELGVSFGDVVTVATEAGSVDVSVFPRGGIPDDVIAIPIGQGHTVGHYASMTGDEQPQPGVARGVNLADILPAAMDEAGGQAFLSTKATVTKTGRFRRLALSQWTDNQRKRGLAPEFSLADLAAPGGMAHFLAATPGVGRGARRRPRTRAARQAVTKPPAATTSPVRPSSSMPRNDAHPDQPYRWGMTIDNDKCTGCSACVTACYVENNISIVGEQQAIKHREMTWLRIERYVGDGNDDVSADSERRPIPSGEVLGETQVRHLPMLCQHCGAAPCEAVCPVIATYHNDEGINGMVYNRCVGTRYCANNCTYKVRRFNYFDYGRKNWPGLLGLMLNPDVTVRGQGVMEKCSFCVQRIETARQPAKDAGKPIAARCGQDRLPAVLPVRCDQLRQRPRHGECAGETRGAGCEPCLSTRSRS